MHFSKFSLLICALALGAAMTVRADDTPAQAAARAAMAAKLFELSSQEPATNAPATAVTPPPAENTIPTPGPAPTMTPDAQNIDQAAVAAAKKEAKAKAKAEKAAAKAKAKADAEAKKNADEAAAAQKAAEVDAAKKQMQANLDQTKPAPPAPAPVDAEKAVMPASPAMLAPPLPISPDKQQKLEDLLAKYRADQVTPDEYQKQRAAILANP